MWYKKILALGVSVMLMSGTAIPCFAAGGDNTAANMKDTSATVKFEEKQTEPKKQAENSEKATEAPKQDASAKDSSKVSEENEQIKVTVSEDGTYTYSYGGKEWKVTPGKEKTSDPSGKVVNVNSYLHLRNGAGMGYDIIGHLLNGDEVKVLGQNGDWYQVSVPEQTGYVHKDYLKVSESDGQTDAVSDSDRELLELLLQQLANTGTSETSLSLTPDGNMALVDDIGTGKTSGQQFLTVTTKNGNYFYLVIDRNENGEENVHFLNQVDERDLISLMDDDEAAEYTTEPATEPTVAVTEPEPTEPVIVTEPEPEKKSSGGFGKFLLMLLMVVGAGGAVYYFKVMKPKQDEDDTQDEDLEFEDETYIDEDAQEGQEVTESESEDEE